MFGCVLQEYFSTKKKGVLEVEEEDYDMENIAVDEEDKKGREEAIEVVKSLFEPIPDDLINLNEVQTLFHGVSSQLPNLTDNISSYEVKMKERVDPEEVQCAAQALCGDNLVSKSTKRALEKIQNDSVIANEYAGAVTIMIANIQEWNWPKSNKFKVVKNLTGKWRMFIEEDIINSLFLQIVGTRWGYYFKSTFKSIFSNPYSTYQREKLQKSYFLNTLPDVIRASNSFGYDKDEGNFKEKITHYLAAETCWARENKEQVEIISWRTLERE